MPLIILLNVMLCLAVLVMVVSPLVWAILTQHRDAPASRGPAAEPASATSVPPARSRRSRMAPPAWSA